MPPWSFLDYRPLIKEIRHMKPTPYPLKNPHTLNIAGRLNDIDRAAMIVNGVRASLAAFNYAIQSGGIDEGDTTALLRLTNLELEAVSEMLMAISLEVDHV
ncbi:MAG: hypothetical protein EBT06_04865 [Gammaproteobacteria bacterium]|nr:hypothetical protein [Gammaproteobacteria bacterium]